MNVKLIKNAKCPKNGRTGDAGYDFYLLKDLKIKPRQQVIVDTGVCVEIPVHHAGLFELRSSICNKNKHLILKNPLVDSNYRGELHLILYNDSFVKTLKFNKDDRVASLFVFPIYDKPLNIVNYLSDSNRGTSWSGSSGK